jgi:hypothetical protein
VAAKERTERARDLRLTDSRAEQEVWELLRAHRMGGLKFRRQHPIGPYFADFACVARSSSSKSTVSITRFSVKRIRAGRISSNRRAGA